jgi:hypothetical protein
MLSHCLRWGLRLLALGSVALLLGAVRPPVKVDPCFLMGKRYGRCFYKMLLGTPCSAAEAPKNLGPCQETPAFDHGVKAMMLEMQQPPGPGRPRR